MKQIGTCKDREGNIAEVFEENGKHYRRNPKKHKLWTEYLWDAWEAWQVEYPDYESTGRLFINDIKEHMGYDGDEEPDSPAGPY